MKPYTLLLVPVLAAAAGGPLRSQDAPPPAAPSSGKVLLLENERALEGDVERVGDQYRVRRSIGETWVPGANVLHLCASYEEGYAFLRGRANLNDADERLRLAQWCRQYGLRRQALEEVQAAALLRPEHAETRRLLNGLLQAEATSTSSAPPAPRPESPSPPPVDVSADCVAQFVTRVQPILMNACASCHAAGTAGEAFRLQRCYESGGNSRRAMQHNLSLVVAQINFAQPGLSPLLIKAVSTHGPAMNRAPLADRQAPAYLALQEWVKRTVANNPHLQSHPAESAVAAAAEPSGFAAPHPAAPAPPTTPPAPPTPTPTAAPGPGPVVSPNIIDVVDPEMFNREHHPERYSPKP
jgi:hypothetical protein